MKPWLFGHFFLWGPTGWSPRTIRGSSKYHSINFSSGWFWLQPGIPPDLATCSTGRIKRIDPEHCPSERFRHFPDGSARIHRTNQPRLDQDALLFLPLPQANYHLRLIENLDQFSRIFTFFHTPCAWIKRDRRKLPNASFGTAAVFQTRVSEAS